MRSLWQPSRKLEGCSFWVTERRFPRRLNHPKPNAMKALIPALLLALLCPACQYPVDSAQLPTLKKFVVIDADISEQGGKLRVAATRAQ